ncbi:hypothetical protein GlitD10_0531 [Gloeomargarita lithophora Alchichica-D10]|uniref:tRNA nuclease CdiA C-terminal domain-containing protein n=1 Tax=Gloeomargarita lithophora Alchichica-D10 TaxID=1188229 RepID=A0A1J0AAB1_9CYAN|nr:hypothetical protein [Gloeomargarita lithophora]APB32845.1 hypothetical protein GlitD10_0531 [Gloeomargarita lithophora Alchichica-D10]
MDIEELPQQVDDEAMELDERIRRSEQIYRQAGYEYERVRFNPDNGGFVLVHRGHNRGESYESELFVAQVLANQGRRVTLLNETGMGAGVKTPDADIDGNLAEFKWLTTVSRKIPNRIQEGFLNAKAKGVNWIVYHVDRQEVIYEEINRGLRQGINFDSTGEITKFLLVLKDGIVRELTREEWNDGQRF